MSLPTTKASLYLSMIFLLTACGQGLSQDTTPKTRLRTLDTTEPNMYRAEANDLEINSAIAKVRFTLPQFDNALGSNKYYRGWNMLKVRFPLREHEG
jgi:hypothetical protein